MTENKNLAEMFEEIEEKINDVKDRLTLVERK